MEPGMLCDGENMRVDLNFLMQANIKREEEIM
jgi:hypothetical protein